MKQLSATELKVSKTPVSEGKTTARRESRLSDSSQQKVQNKSRNPSISRSASTANGKVRKKVDLPLNPQVVNRNARANQPNYTNKNAPQNNVEREPLRRVQLPQEATEKQRIIERTVIAPRPQREKRRNHRINTLTKSLLYASRVLIFGVGIAAIAGTVLSVLDPTNRIKAEDAQTPVAQEEVTEVAVVPGSALQMTQEMSSLKTTVEQLAAKQKNLLPGVFFLDLDTGAYLEINGNSTFASASMIKVPVLVAFFQDVDAGKIRLDERLTLKKELVGGGSGDMQYKPLGTKFTALETATKMITISDNTATNLLIERMGGAAALNERFLSWGLPATQIRNLLPDLEGTNTTSPRDLAQLMALIDDGKLMSLRSRDRLLDIMRGTVTNTLLPRGLGEGARIAHKTGDIGSLVGDVGLVDMPSGKRYIAVAMVKRPHNDGRAQELIRQISRAAYQELSKPNVDQIMRTTPFVTTNPPAGNSATTSNPQSTTN
ncbi:serine hydrolase [Chroogloeocystis siderophila 5.2 s.c.1]|uniref:Serine hydrolase n=1 Tax=Chroogloeocystis siderophila 5.2 s.c.1 TaxID=247279 RepID=A0A1U7HP50_9CHRO|nr:serine hydrolase [Chroogloeocystis siderophila]OKH25328.1 serine hydrolase [Chroogloeocystis siderophila 5.2 s.c.1]